MTKLSIQGAGIMGRPSVSADLFDTLSQANINVRLIATSCLLYTSPSPRDATLSRMPSSA